MTQLSSKNALTIVEHAPATVPCPYGAIPVEQRLNTYLPLSAGGTDYLTDTASWLAVQDGAAPSQQQRVDPTPRHARNGRDLAAYVHHDVLYEAYLNACIWLVDNNAPLNPGNPYNSSRNQTGFGTFGSPHVKALLAEVATRALKAVWFQKWFVHRCLRPEEFGGLVHVTKTHQASYPLHPDVLNSQAVAEVFERNGSYLMPHAFPEGCPLHPKPRKRVRGLTRPFSRGPRKSLRPESSAAAASAVGSVPYCVKFTSRNSAIQ